MFDLEQQIQAWRQRALAELSGRPEVIDELESHLREETQRLVQSGQQPPEAWATALSRLGSSEQLAGEFRKVLPAAEAWLPGRAVLVALICVFVPVIWLFLSKLLQGQMELLLAAHVLSIVAGYLAVFAVGTLAVWSLLIRALRGWDDRRATAFRAYALLITVAGAILTLVGVVLGACWASEHLGRFWGWDSKEVGGLAVLCWHGVMLAGLRLRRLAVAPLILGVLGNIVVSLSWFGPSAAAPAHSYGQARALAGFVIVQGLILLLGLLPQRLMQHRRT